MMIHTLKHLDSQTLGARQADLEVVLSAPAKGDGTECDESAKTLERWRWPHGYFRVHIAQDRRLAADRTTDNAATLLGMLWPEGDETTSGDARDVFVQAGLELSPLTMQWVNAAFARYAQTAPLGGAVLLPTKQQTLVSGAHLTALISAIAGEDGFVVDVTLRRAFWAWCRKSMPVSLLQDFGIDGRRGDSLGHAFRVLLATYFKQTNKFTLQPSGLLLARRHTVDTASLVLADVDHRLELPIVPDAVDENGDTISLCMSDICPSRSLCRDTLAGPICSCLNADQSSCMQQLTGLPGADRPVLLTDAMGLGRLLQHVSRDGKITLMTASSGFVDFTLNLIISMKKVGVDNFLIVAEDFACYQRLNAKFPGRVVLPTLRMMMSGMAAEGAEGDSIGFSYASKQYNELVARRPRYLLAILEAGYDVLYTDTDTVWLENPYNQFLPGYDLQIASDKEGMHVMMAVFKICPHNGWIDETFSPWHMLCTGFMYMKSNEVRLPSQRLIWLCTKM
jgi:hypothetical protein